jgi:hypothetical protein
MRISLLTNANRRALIAVVLGMCEATACSSASNVDENPSTSTMSSGGAGAGATGGMATGETGGRAHAGGGSGGKASGGAGGVAASGAAGKESGGARGCGQPTLFLFDLYPNCDGVPQPVCVEIPPSNLCYCDSTTSHDGGTSLRLPRSFGPCPGAERPDAEAGVTDAGRE